MKDVGVDDLTSLILRLFPDILENGGESKILVVPTQHHLEKYKCFQVTIKSILLI